MPLTVQIPFTRYLDDQGQPQGDLPGWVDDPPLLLELYRQMNLVRLFDQKCVALQRTGQIGTYASTLGQEAVGTALGRAMSDADVLIPYYRDTATQLQRGVQMQDILLYWGGDERGSAWSAPGAVEDFPICVPIATQACHACGVAAAFRIRQQPRVAVTTCGDGATSKGRSEEHTSELQSRPHLVCRLLLEKKKINRNRTLLDSTSKISSRRINHQSRTQLRNIENKNGVGPTLSEIDHAGI